MSQAPKHAMSKSCTRCTRGKPRWTTCKIMSTPVNKLNVISSFRLPNLSTATVSTDVNWTPLSHLVFEHCQFCLCGVHLMNHIPSTFRSGRNLSAVFYINWGKTRTPTALSVWYRVAEKFVSFVISFIVITNNVDSLVVSGPAKQQDLSIHQRGAEVKPTYPYISP